MTEEERLIIEGQTEDARVLVEAARLQLMRYRPFYGSLIAAMPVMEGIGWLTTICTNGRDIIFNPEFIAGMTPERKKLVFSRVDRDIQDPIKNSLTKEYVDVFFRKKTAREVCFLLEHEVRHVVADHITRGKGLVFDIFNIAADHYINTDLVVLYSKPSEINNSSWFPKGKDTVFDKDEEFGFMLYGYCDFKYLGMYTEQIYDLLVKKGISHPKGGMAGTDSHMNGKGGLGSPFEVSPEDGESGDSQADKNDVNNALGIDESQAPPVKEEDRKKIDHVMRRAIENAALSAGKAAPEDIRKFLEEQGKPRINYLKLLKRTIERLFRKNVSFRRLHRKSHSLTFTLRNRGYIDNTQYLVLPSYQKEKTINVHVGFDVSGSFTDTLLRPTIREIKGLCKVYDDFNVTLFCWSTKVGDVKTYTKKNHKEMSDYKIKTTYGTDAKCVFELLDSLKESVDQVIVYTDGEFSDISKVKDWARKYGNKTLWVISGRKRDWTPPFGSVIMFDKLVK